MPYVDKDRSVKCNVEGGGGFYPKIPLVFLNKPCVGWPSFFDLLKEESVSLADDFSYGLHRVETTCSQVSCNTPLYLSSFLKVLVVNSFTS